MEFSILKTKAFWKKALKVSLFFQIFILALGFIKSYLSGTIDGLTVRGFLEAFAISGVCGLFVGVYLAVKDESL